MTIKGNDQVLYQQQIQREAEETYNRMLLEMNSPLKNQIVQQQQQGEGDEGDGENAEEVNNEGDEGENEEGDDEGGEGEEEEEENEDDPFYKKVDALHGFEVPIEYGDIDPDTPEGFHMREVALMEIGGEQMLGEIKERYPDAFRYLQHVQKGGTLTDFIAPVTLPEVSSLKGNLESQQAFNKRYLVEVKGLSEIDATAIVKGRIDSKTIDDFTTQNHSDWEKIEKAKADSVEQEVQQIEARKADMYDILDEITVDILTKNKLSITIPDTQKKNVAESFYGNVVYLQDQLVHAIPITDENAATLIQLDYLAKNPKVLNDLLGIKEGKKKIVTIKDKIKSKTNNSVSTGGNSADDDPYYRNIKNANL